MKVQLTDLLAHRARIGDQIDEALLAVARSGRWIMGAAIDKLEEELASYCGVRNAISCSNGTDALVMSLLALGAGPGEAVICPTFTFAATAEAVALIGATPVFADCGTDGFNVSPFSVRLAIKRAREAGLTVRGIVAVDLFGVAADYGSLHAIANEEGLWLLADAAQSFGCVVDGVRVGSLAQLTTTSFFPAKPLGCYGDGGALLTDDDELAGVLRSLRVHGKGSHKYDNERIGLNARLDPMQAVVLSEKLTIFDSELEQRQWVASMYDEGLASCVGTPVAPVGMSPAWAQYTILTPDRTSVQSSLTELGIGTAIYYPKPLHRQTAFAGLSGSNLVACPRADELSDQVLSIPMHPYLEQDEIRYVVDGVVAALDAKCTSATSA